MRIASEDTPDVRNRRSHFDRAIIESDDVFSPDRAFVEAEIKGLMLDRPLGDSEYLGKFSI